MKVLVTGKKGQLGKSIYKIIINNKQVNSFIFVGREELDLSNEKDIAHYFKNNIFDVIINCAAYTAVDKAEEEENLANQVNHIAVKQLAQIAKNQQAKLIHISTDYVFDGESDKPYTETDATNPINVYGKTKLAGEQVLKEIMPTDAIIIRTSWLYSEYGNNFVKTMLKLGQERDELSVVSDQIGSPTYATDLANTILDIMQNAAFKEIGHETQVYHYSNEGEISWYEFAKEVILWSKMNCEIVSITTEHYPTLAHRPKHNVMTKDKLTNTFGIMTINWKDALKRCMSNYNEKN